MKLTDPLAHLDARCYGRLCVSLTGVRIAAFFFHDGGRCAGPLLVPRGARRVQVARALCRAMIALAAGT